MTRIDGGISIDGVDGLNLQPRPQPSEASETSFGDILGGLVQKVNSLQQDADKSINGLVTGETTNVHDVTIKTTEAGLAFDLMMEIRNKLLDAYQQIMKMQP